jgi:phage-related holin
MRTLLFIIAAVLAIIWAIGFFVFKAENAIHVLLVFAIATVIQGLVKDEDPLYIKGNQTWKVQD